MADLQGHAPVHSTPLDLFRSGTATTSIKDKISNIGASSDVLCLLPDLCPEKSIPTKQTTSINKSASLGLAQKNSITDGTMSAPSTSIDEDEKLGRTERYDSSESSDSGVASLTCSDASPWSSSSDITEPLSPSSSISSQPSPLSQTHAEGSGTAERTLEPSTSTTFVPTICPAGSSRRRRYSESTAREDVPDGVGGKRTRRPSGEGEKDRSSCLANWPSNIKWLTYVWKSSGGPDKDVLDLPNRNATSPTAEKRQSWPLQNNNRPQQQPLAQLKITEFFSTQVKHHWSYSKACAGLKELKERLPNESIEAGTGLATVNTAAILTPQESPCIQTTSSDSSLQIDNTSKTTCPPPQQIRFPVDQRSDTKAEALLTPSPEVTQCLWQGCTASLGPEESLLDHIQNVHVATQASSSPTSTSSSSTASTPAEDSAVAGSSTEEFSCEWEGCKVQGRKSSSRTWLERHVLLHVGNKPFRCIVDSCGQRFSSQVALERHVNAHFNQESGHQGGGSNGLKRESAAAKLARRHAKKLKNRCCKAKPAHLCDFFDAGIMERLRHQLATSHVRQSGLGLSWGNRTLTVHSQIIAKRTDGDGKSRVLIRWTPKDLIPDQWMMEDQVESSKTIPLHNLSSAAQISLTQQFELPAVRVKQRRK